MKALAKKIYVEVCTKNSQLMQESESQSKM